MDISPDITTPEALKHLAASLLPQRLNAECFCVGIDSDALRRAIEATSPGLSSCCRSAARTCLPHDRFLFRPHRASACRRLSKPSRLSAYREAVLSRSPEIARHTPGASGVFFGYDFHATEAGFGLIEINTNAGGAMLNAVLVRAQRACCAPIQHLLRSADMAEALEAGIVAMFRREWTLSGRSHPLRRIAIVDEQPQQQYLYPEFLLFKDLFQRHGIDALIADPTELRLHAEVLYVGEQAVDLV